MSTQANETVLFPTPEAAGLSPQRIDYLKALLNGTLGFDTNPQFNMFVAEPAAISGAEIQHLEQVGEDHFALIDSVVQLYSLVRDATPQARFSSAGPLGGINLLQLKGLFEYGLGDDEAGNLIRLIMAKYSEGVFHGISRGPSLVRLDEIGHTGKYSEGQLAAGGNDLLIRGTQHEHPDYRLIGSGGTAINAFAQVLKERADLQEDRAPRVAFHVGNGVAAYRWNFLELASAYCEAFGNGSAQIILGGPQAQQHRAELLSALEALGRAQFNISILTEDETLEAALNEQEVEGRGCEVIYRLSDSPRFNQQESLPLLRRIAAGTLKLEPPLMALQDNSHLVQALLFDPRLQPYFTQALGEDRLRRVQEQFFPSAILGTNAKLAVWDDESASITVYDLDAPATSADSRAVGYKDLKKRLVIRTLLTPDGSKLSGGFGLARIEKRAEYDSLLAESAAALQELAETGHTDKRIFSVMPYIRSVGPTVTGHRLIQDPLTNAVRIEAKTFTDSIVRRNPFLLRTGNGSSRTLLYGLSEYLQETGWKAGAGAGKCTRYYGQQ